MKKLMMLAAAIALTGCSSVKLVQDNNGKLLYTYDSNDLGETVQLATKACVGKGMQTAELVGSPACGGSFCIPNGLCFSTCSAKFECK